ncbi:MAG: nitrogen assimilation response regulator NtrX [Rhodobacterales bacterium]|nr:sigma-54 dependent transcriptional regulator [Amylibacter sp.]
MGDILIVDDEKDIRELVSDILIDEGYSTDLAANSEETFKSIKKSKPQLIILDIWLKESKLDGIDILKHVKLSNPDIPIVIISGHGNIEIAVAAIKQGAYDFIEKPFNIDQLTVVIARAMETSRLRSENAAFKVREIPSFELIGNSSVFKNFKQQLEKVSNGNSRIMLSGSSGAGKEVAARYIHKNSPRKDFAFITVNSASMSSERMEELLFGSEVNGKVHMGLLEKANGGILYLDEVGDMPIGTQSKILRILVDQQFMRIGGNTNVSVDFRVISSSSHNLLAEIKDKNFREELYHRLNVIPISVPSLEERIEDIPLISNFFISELSEKQGLPKRNLSQQALVHLQSRNWPGNIRQLRNVLERSLILGAQSGEITVNELQTKNIVSNDNTVDLNSNTLGLPLREARELFERDYLVAQVNRFGGNISKTSNFVGMERSALHRKLKSLNVVTSNDSGARVAKTDDIDTNE